MYRYYFFNLSMQDPYLLLDVFASYAQIVSCLQLLMFNHKIDWQQLYGRLFLQKYYPYIQ